MESKYSVSLAKIIADHSFEILYTPKDASEIYISSQEVNRPGLIFAGYTDHFDSTRVQFLGLAELDYLSSLGKPESDDSSETVLTAAACRYHNQRP